MFPKINEKAMATAMKKMGIKQQEIDAKEVIIKTENNNLIIKNPNVVKINMMGQEMFQVSGDVEETSSFNEDDIKTVMEQTGLSEEKCRKALEETNGDLAEAIIRLKNA